MKKVVLLILLLLPFNVKAQTNINLFYGKECPYCQKEEKNLKILKYQLGDNINIKKYEVWHNKKNNELLTKVKNEFSSDKQGVPFTTVGDKYFTGYNDEIFKNIKSTILENIKKPNTDIVEKIKTDKQTKSVPSINFPLIGNVDIKTKKTKLVAFISGISDGINLNTIWLMLFLSSILLCIYNNKKRTILGGIFVLTSFITYMFFILNNVSLSITACTIIRSVISIISIIIGAISFDAYIKIEKPQKSLLQIISEKLGKRQMMFYIISVIFVSILTSFALINSAQSTPVLLSLMKGNYKTLFYAIGYLLSNIIIFITISVIIKELIMENTIGTYSRLISLIVTLICAFIILYIPSIFMMV
ncbi:MAG: hypothetical protein PUA73_00575 [Bacilli bacterium]|nr:hypothetical protein [Bacilli bacterium]